MTNDKVLREFMYKYRFEDIQIEKRKKYATHTHGFNGITAMDYVKTIDTIIEDIVKCKLPSDQLERIAEIVTEWNSLYENPESARLIHEARFINRLKKGF